MTVSLPQDRFVPALSILEIEAVVDNPYNATLNPSWEAIYFDSYYNMSEWTLDWLTTDGFSAFLDTNNLYRFADGNIVYLLLRSAGGYEHVAIAADGPQEQRQYAMITQRSGQLTLDEQSIAALHIGEVSLFDGGEFFSIRIGNGISNERFELKIDSLTDRDVTPFESTSFSNDNAQIELSITNGHDNGIEWGGSMGEQCATMTVHVEHLDGVAYPVDYIERYAANVTVTCDHKMVTFEVRKFTETE